MKLTVFISVLQVLAGLVGSAKAQGNLYLPGECVPSNLRQIFSDMSNLSNQIDGIIDDMEGLFNGILADNSVQVDSVSSNSVSTILDSLRSANSDVRGCQAGINADVGLRRQLSLDRELQGGNLSTFWQITQVNLQKLSDTLSNLFHFTTVFCAALDPNGATCEQDLALIGIHILSSKEITEKIKHIVDIVDVAIGHGGSGGGGGKGSKRARRGRRN